MRRESTHRESLRLPDALVADLDRLGDRFLATFYAAELRRHPGNLEALASLGQVYTGLGQYEEGLAVDRQLARLVPMDPTAHYNLACSLALLGRRDEALDALEHAVRLGYADPEFMQSDEDLACLRHEERFLALVRQLSTGARA